MQGAKIDKNWSLFRHLNSLFATWLAKPLVKISDPMSGFFAFHYQNLPPIATLRPIGYKIALEILVKGNFQHINEHAITFNDRQKGKSKLTAKQQLNYIRHLRRLYQYKYGTWAELAQFAIIGSIGVFVDLFFYLSLQYLLNLPHQLARAISFWPAVTHNWFMNRTITFNHRIKQNRLKQWFSFVTTSLIGFSINWGSYSLLTTTIDWFINSPIYALPIGIFLGMGFNFLFSNILVFHDLRKEH